jgi:hypothetical protein
MTNFTELKGSEKLWVLTDGVVEALRACDREVHHPEICRIVHELQVDAEAALEDKAISALVEFARAQVKEGVLKDEALIHLIGQFGFILHRRASPDPNYNERIGNDWEGEELLIRNARLFVYTDMEGEKAYTYGVVARILKIIFNNAKEQSKVSYDFKDIKSGHLDLLQVDNQYHCKASLAISDGTRINTVLKVDEVN